MVEKNRKEKKVNVVDIETNQTFKLKLDGDRVVSFKQFPTRRKLEKYEG